jgi:hypothetical protein
MLELGQFVLAAGAVGTAAMGIVEGCKSAHFRPIGFSRFLKSIQWAEPALIRAYGPGQQDLVESLYRLNRSKGDLPRILRQGVRIGLNETNAAEMEGVLLGAGRDDLPAIAKKASRGEELDKQERNLLGRFEVAADARIDAALSLAERAYKNGVRARAFVVALALSCGASFSLGATSTAFSAFDRLVLALIVGLVAVPVAPIAKDVASGFKNAAKAIGDGP